MNIEFNKEEFDRLAGEFRYVITDMICRAGTGHIGGSLSLVETIITLYWRILNVNPENPKWEGRDRLVLSKGHAGPVLYAALAYRGFFPKASLATLNANGTSLPSHADRLRTPGIDMTAGSLGQGLSVACGMALAGKMNRKQHRVFCIIGDGESDEGQVWEAGMFAGHHKLDNLIAIVDYNKLQIDGFTDSLLTLEPLVDKWKAFNWEVMEMDGHNWDDIYEKLTRAGKIRGKPVMVIAHTVKGKGNIAVENKPESHSIKVDNRETYARYMAGLALKNYSLPY